MDFKIIDIEVSKIKANQNKDWLKIEDKKLITSQTKMENKHHLHCGASICQCDTNPDYKKEAVWLPGEPICNKKPYQKFQQVQFEINKSFKQGKFTKENDGYRAIDLENKSI